MDQAGTRPAEPNGESMWKQLPSGRVEHRFELPVLVAALALIPVLIIENFAKGQTWQDFAWAANWVIWAVFAAELAFILMRSSLSVSAPILGFSCCSTR